MKGINITALVGILSLSVACTSNQGDDQGEGTTTNTNPTSEIVVELEDKEEYSADSTLRIEYQINKTTGDKHGVYREYDLASGALLIERTYQHNKMNGLEKIYFPSGQVDGSITYKDGVHEGAFKYYYEDGTVKQEGNYKEGKIEGVLTSYYSNGTIKEEVMHLNGLTQGVFKEYNEDGSLKAEGSYTSKNDRENLEQGVLKMYDETGVLSKKMICKEGQCCTVWTQEDGDIKPSSKLCEAIIQSQSAESLGD